MNLLRRHGAVANVGIIKRSGRVGKEDDLVVMKHCVTCGSMAAVFGGRPGNDNCGDPPLAKNEIEVGREKRAVAMLLDDMLARSRRKVGEDLHARSSINQRGVV